MPVQMQQIQAPWDADPQLWKQSAFQPFIDAYGKAISTNMQDTESQVMQQKLQESKDKDAVDKQLGELIKANPNLTSDQLLQQMRGVYAGAGDVKSVLGLDRDARSEQKANDSAERLDQQETTANINSVLQIAKSDPELATAMWAKLGLGDKLGTDVDLSKLEKQDKSDVRGGLKEGLWRVGDDGNVQILREPAPGSDKPYKPKFSEFVDDDGKAHPIDMNDPESVDGAYAAGWQKNTPAIANAREIDKVTHPEKYKKSAPADSGPGVLDQVFQYLSGSQAGAQPGPAVPAGPPQVTAPGAPSVDFSPQPTIPRSAPGPGADAMPPEIRRLQKRVGTPGIS